MKIIFFISLFILSSCEIVDYGELNIYCVPANEHYSDFPKLMQTEKEIYVKIFFHESCRYAPQLEDKSGWNKLIGLMPGWDPHINSARWAWRYDHEYDLIKLATYTYIDGTRNIEYIFSVPLQKWIELYVGYNDNRWFLLTGENELGKNILAPGLKRDKYYILGLYFGGNGTPEHQICVSYIFGEEKGFRINTD